MKQHSILGASSAHRWWMCPGSVRLSADVVDIPSVYAKEGTAAHELAERCLKNGYDADRFLGETIVVGNDAFEIDQEMADAVQTYLDAVRAEVCSQIGAGPGHLGELLVEQKFDLGSLYPGMFGTNDACVYHRQAGRLVVFDYKHGRGHAVEAKDNPQLLYYGYGAATMSADRPLTEVELVIVQPRAPHKDGPVRRWTISAMDLLDWSGDLVDAARRTEDPDAYLLPGDHCTFCRAAAVCPALRTASIDAAKAEFGSLATDLSTKEISAILKKADMIEDWLHAVRAHALTLLETGTPVPGFKLVEKRAIRKWINDEIPEEVLFKHGLTADRIYTRKALSPAQIEKILPKHLKPIIQDHVIKQSSGYTLASDDDSRQAVNRNASDDFTAV